MSEDLIKEIFITIAFKAMDEGREIRLEKGKNSSKSNTLGSISTSESDHDSFSLMVYNNSVSIEEEEEEEE